MADQPDFWNIDFSRLTLSGYLAILLASAIFFGAFLATLALFTAIGLERDAANPGGDRWMAIVAFIPAIVAGSATFLGLSILFGKLGLPTVQKRPGE